MKNKVRRKLEFELIRRSIFNNNFNLILPGFVWLLFSQLNFKPWWWTLGLALIFVFAGLALATRRIVLGSKDISRRAVKISCGLVLATGVIWGCLATAVIQIFGLFCFESVVFLFVIYGLLCGVLHSLSPSRSMQRSYFILMCAPVIAMIFMKAWGPSETPLAWAVLTLTSYIWMISNSHSKELIQIFTSELQLQREREKSEQLINSVPGFVFEMTHDLKIVEQSKSVDERFHFHKNSIDLSVASDAHFFKILGDFIKNPDQSSATQEIELVEGHEPHLFLVSMSKSKLVKDHLVVVGIAIGDLKKMKQELHVQTSKAEYAARLATLGEMAGGIAHEVNNPLAVIMGNAGQMIKMIDAPATTPAQLKDKAQKIIATSHRISKIIQGMRQFSRQGDRDPFAPTSLRQVVEDTLELCRERFYRFQVNLLLETVPEVLLPGRAVQISQVMLNILNNAFDAIQGCPEKFIQVRFKKDADYLYILISDCGPGIPPTVAEKIFQPFYTTKDVGKGTGLGLSISTGIINDHQGHLRLVPGEALTTFEIKLPFKRSDEKAKSAKSAA